MRLKGIVEEDLMLRYQMAGKPFLARVLKVREEGATPLEHPVFVQIPFGKKMLGSLVELGINQIEQHDAGVLLKGSVRVVS